MSDIVLKNMEEKGKVGQTLFSKTWRNKVK